LTNAATMVGDETLLALLHRRETLRRRRNIHETVANSATPSRGDYRFMRTEIKFVPQVDVRQHRATAEVTDTEIRALEARIQATNWETDLL